MKLALITLCARAVGYCAPYFGIALLVLWYAK